MEQEPYAVYTAIDQNLQMITPTQGNDINSAESGIMDPLTTFENDDSTYCDGFADTSVNDLVIVVLNRIKNPYLLQEIKHEAEGSTQQKYNKHKTKEKEMRLLRQRMLQMKNRLLLQLELPEKAEAAKKRSTIVMRSKRQKQREMETPEEAAARKKRHADQVRLSRKRLLALESPEQTAARIARRNEKKKLRLQERQAKETPEERAMRRERDRAYREKYRERYKKDFGKLAIKTGRLRTAKLQKGTQSQRIDETLEQQPTIESSAEHN